MVERNVKDRISLLEDPDSINFEFGMIHVDDIELEDTLKLEEPRTKTKVEDVTTDWRAPVKKAPNTEAIDKWLAQKSKSTFGYKVLITLLLAAAVATVYFSL